MVARVPNRRVPRAARWLLLSAVSAAAFPASAETEFQPFVEARAVGSLNDFSLDNFRYWGEASAGFLASVDSRRVDGSVRYRLRRRLPIGDDVSDRVRHEGSGSLSSILIRDYLYASADAQASVVTPNFGGLINPDFDDPNQQQTYGGSAGPSFNHVFNNRISVNANYRYSIFEVEGGRDPLMIGRPFELGQGLGGASDQRSQTASASIGNTRRSDRVRLRAIGSYQRDRIEQLDQHFRYVRGVGDGDLALTRFLSLVGSFGYEEIEDEQDAILVDPVTGLPIVSPEGLLQPDPINPRLVTFEYKGPTYDAGVRLTPSRRTSLVVRVGRRYGDFSAYGAFNQVIRSDLVFTASYNDGINSFGRLFTTFFNDPVTGQVTPIASFRGGGRRTPIGTGSCAFGFDRETGACQFNLTRIASGAVFRERTAYATLQLGQSDFDDEAQRFYGYLSGFFTHRRYLGDRQPSSPGQVGFNPALYLAGTRDVSYGLTAHGERLLSRRSYVVFDLRAQRNKYALSNDLKDVFLSARAQYEMLVDRNINLFGTAFVGKRYAEAGNSPLAQLFGVRDSTPVTFSVGVRYLFAPYRGAFTPSEHAQSLPY
jgi:hypothetical protein